MYLNSKHCLQPFKIKRRKFVDLENLAYMKQTWLSLHSTEGASDTTVDGKISVSHEQCAISEPNTTVTWWVNLGKIYRLDHVQIYFKTGNLNLDT